MLAILAILALAAGGECTATYSGEQVYRVQTQSPAQLEYLRTLEEAGLDFWTEIRIGSVDVRVGTAEKEMVEEGLADFDIPYSIMIEDLESLISESKSWMFNGTKRAGAKHSMDWTSYHPVKDMQEFMDYLAETYDYVSVSSIGQSYEGNDMRVMSVCRGGCGNKPAMWIDGGIHAREWVSPATVTYMMNELVENDAEHPDLTQDLDWYFLPSVNPDGYAYSIESQRLWRKTRSSNGGGCYGTDANRNWGFHWNEGGSSNDPCSDTYHGKSAFSEIENQNVRDFVFERKDKIKFFNTIHSYSQFVLLPWGWGYEQPNNFDDLQMLAFTGVAELTAVHGTRYTVGCIPCLLYVASGGSLDWALGEAGIPYSYGMELRDTGSYGFLLPPQQIIPTGEETWAFHLTVAREIVKEFGI